MYTLLIMRRWVSIPHTRYPQQSAHPTNRLRQPSTEIDTHPLSTRSKGGRLGMAQNALMLSKRSNRHPPVTHPPLPLSFHFAQTTTLSADNRWKLGRMTAAALERRQSTRLRTISLHTPPYR